jgi:uncharacterized membrane protein
MDGFDLTGLTRTEFDPLNTNATFSVTPRTNLPVGTHFATVMITGNNGILKTFSVTHTAVDTSTFGIELKDADDNILSNTLYEFDDDDPITGTIENTGTGTAENLRVTLTGTSADSFTVTQPETTTSTTFTVEPNAGLPAGNYTATVVVTGSNGILETFDVKYFVAPANTGISSIVKVTVAAAAASGEIVIAAYDSDGTLLEMLPGQALVLGEHTYEFDVSDIDDHHDNVTFRAFVLYTEGGRFFPLANPVTMP